VHSRNDADVADDDDKRGRETGFDLGERATEQGIESDNPEVVLADEHAFEGLAALVEHHEVERLKTRRYLWSEDPALPVA
jgi:hypothetical protein